MNSGEMATRLGLSGIPREAEIIMLERDIRLVGMTGARYHAAHISTADSVEIIARAKDDPTEIHAVKHREYPVWGVQFHPESILTESGKEILRNFLTIGR